MRLLADENIALPAVYALRSAGLDVASVAEDRAGASDVWVLQFAKREGRVLLTHDRDFGELVFRGGASGEPGVVYCRFVPRTPTELSDVILHLLRNSTVGFQGYFTVLDRDHVRQRLL